MTKAVKMEASEISKGKAPPKRKKSEEGLKEEIKGTGIVVVSKPSSLRGTMQTTNDGGSYSISLRQPSDVQGQGLQQNSQCPSYMKGKAVNCYSSCMDLTWTHWIGPTCPLAGPKSSHSDIRKQQLPRHMLL